MLTQTHKKDFSGSATKTTTSVAPGVKITYTKKPEPFGNQITSSLRKGCVSRFNETQLRSTLPRVLRSVKSLFLLDLG